MQKIPVALGEPDCKQGYPLDQLKREMKHGAVSFWPEFSRWFAGQTGAICMGEPDGLGCLLPHGLVVYTHDVERFLALREDAEWVV